VIPREGVERFGTKIKLTADEVRAVIPREGVERPPKPKPH
jgi:hypothetical protein